MPLGNGYHVIPLGDLIKHDFLPDCVCGPAVAQEPDEDDPTVINFIFTHHALDGRERPDRKAS